MNVSLPPELNRWVEEHVASGLYSSASEVVREALRLLRERENLAELRREQLRLLIQAGVDDLDAGRVEPADDAMFEWIAAEGARRSETRRS